MQQPRVVLNVIEEGIIVFERIACNTRQQTVGVKQNAVKIKEVNT
jgi:hypothetical protein